MIAIRNKLLLLTLLATSTLAFAETPESVTDAKPPSAVTPVEVEVELDSNANSATPVAPGTSATRPETVVAAPSAGTPAPLTAEGPLKKRVEFWVSIYTQFSTSEGVIHDAKYPEIILEKLDFRAEQEDYHTPPAVKEKRAQNRISDIKDFYRDLMLSIHKKQQDLIPLNEAEKRVYELYKDIKEPNKFYNAAHNKRIRFQLGQRDRFLQGLFYSGRYLPMMEKIFRERGIPIEITRLPFVESSFNLKARSKVGASGIWQFMRSTGKFYLKINDTIDERNDPIRATEAAASLMKLNIESLGQWPLAITAYNHGRKGLMRAVRKVGSDNLDEIIDGYRSRSFGFASSNFFTEFMAAAEVERNAAKYFGKFERDHPIEFAEFVLNDYINAIDLSTYSRIPMDTLMDLNPGLTDTVFQGKRLIPAGYVLRIPADMRDKFLARYNEIPPSKKYISQKGPHYDMSAPKTVTRRKRSGRHR
ncbi:MAG: lytic transglycosylase domain-containing protein [Deltaproteobacteria bacterium]|nr:lytic transglycosylase domain-containing protein [Deltaproteobacteria bacterium]